MKSLLREFDEQAQKAIVVAESLSFDFGHQNVGSEHLLLSLLKIHDNQLKRLLQKYDVNDAVVEEDIKRLFGTNDDQPFYMEYSQSVKRILLNTSVTGLSAVNGTLPASISQAMMPTEYRSPCGVA